MSSEEMQKIQAEHIIEGLELSLQRLGPELLDQVDGMTQKQLRRALKSTIKYIYMKEDDTDLTAVSKREQKFIGGMISIVETGVQYSLHIISQLQKEKMKKENNNETSEGENNERI